MKQLLRMGVLYVLMSCTAAENNPKDLNTKDFFEYVYGDHSSDLRRVHHMTHTYHSFQRDSVEIKQLLDNGYLFKARSRLDSLYDQAQSAREIHERSFNINTKSIRFVMN